MKNYKRIITIFISIAMIIGMCSASLAAEFADKIILEYDQIAAEASAFLDKCDMISELEAAGDTEKLFPMYYELYDSFLGIYDQYVLYQLLSDEDVTNTKNTEIMSDIYTSLFACESAFYEGYQEVLNGELGEEFAEYLNDEELVENIKGFESTSEEEQELAAEELELVSQYNQVVEKYEGDATDKKLQKEAGEIFLKLVEIRNRIAILNGYDNYNDYCDDFVYLRDYGSSDLELMKQAVRKFGNSNEFNYYMVYALIGELDVDNDELIELLGKSVSGISTYVDEQYDVLKDNKYYSIGSSSKRAPGAYTTTLQKNKLSFIFSTNAGYLDDLSSIIHEFGHFVDFGITPNPDIEFYTASLDIAEISSTGLQALATPSFESLFGDDGKLLYAWVLSELISCITEGCLYDEWQRMVYENPGMTLEEINQCFVDVSAEYGVDNSGDAEATWMLVSHNFDSPLYYISYAVSAVVSLQIWDLSLTDYEAAAKAWENIILSDEYKDTYMNVVESAGLIPFTDTDKVYEILSTAYRYTTEQINLDGLLKDYPELQEFVEMIEEELGYKVLDENGHYIKRINNQAEDSPEEETYATGEIDDMEDDGHGTISSIINAILSDEVDEEELEEYFDEYLDDYIDEFLDKIEDGLDEIEDKIDNIDEDGIVEKILNWIFN